MSNYQESLKDYVDVAERASLLFAKYPDASWETSYEGTHEIGGKTFLIMKATVYRTPDDPRPAVDYAWELVPGKTPYTAGSELMVCSTSAIGRAIAGLGIGAKRSISTRDEIKAAKSRNNEQFTDEYKTPEVSGTMRRLGAAEMMTEKQQGLILKLVKGRPGNPIDEYKTKHSILGGFTKADASKFIEYLTANPQLEDPWAAEIARGGSDES
jgi:hypothetical protein